MAGLLITLLTILVLAFLTGLAVQLIRIERNVAELAMIVERAVRKMHEE
jgi:Na+/H+-dicarboxylate symporter